MFLSRAILMVLVVLRLLMPPGICACKWSSPAARLLSAVLHSERPAPVEQESDDDDHAPGCPASPLAVGMGVRPPSEPVAPPAPALDPLPPLETMQPAFSAHTEWPEADPILPLQVGLYLSFRALLL